MKASSLFLMLRSHAIATLAGVAIVASSGPVGAQVVEDKNPVPAPSAPAAGDAVKDAAKSASDTANSAAQQAGDTAKQATDTAKQATDSAAKQTTDTARQAGNAAQQTTNNATQQAGNAAKQATDGAKQATDTAKQATDTAKQATDNAAKQATDPAQRTNVRTNVDASTRTNSADPSAATRINAGVQAGSNAVNAAANTAAAANAANVGTGQIAAQLGLNFAANAANALTLSAINRNSVFANAGFQPNDQFVSIGGTPIANQAAFYRYLGTVPVGQRVPIVVMRNGQQQTIYWTPDQRFVQMQPTFRTYVDAARPVAGGNMLGIQLDPNVTDAAIVASVEQGSQAANAGVRQGDQIVALNDQEVHNAAQFEQAAAQMAPNAPARIAVARTIELQAGAVQQTGVTVSTTTPAAVQPVAPVGVDPRSVPAGPVRRFRFR